MDGLSELYKEAWRSLPEKWKCNPMVRCAEVREGIVVAVDQSVEDGEPMFYTQARREWHTLQPKPGITPDQL